MTPATVREALRRAEKFFARNAEQPGYGYFCGGDPRLFTCDPECTTEAERECHANDCAAWDAWDKGGKQGDPPRHSVRFGRSVEERSDGTTASVHWAGYGLGTYIWVDEELVELRDMCRSALNRVHGRTA